MLDPVLDFRFVYLHGEAQVFLSQGQYVGASLKGSWFLCAKWLPDMLHAKEYMDEVTQPASPPLLQACAVSIVALATWTAATNFSPS